MKYNNNVIIRNIVKTQHNVFIYVYRMIFYEKIKKIE